MKDNPLFMKCMARLDAIFSRETDKILLDIYWELLLPFSNDDCFSAFVECASRCKFYPKPADLLEYMPGSEVKRKKNAVIEADKIINCMMYNQNFSKVVQDPISRYLMVKVWPYEHWASHLTNQGLEKWRYAFITQYVRTSKGIKDDSELKWLVAKFEVEEAQSLLN